MVIHYPMTSAVGIVKSRGITSKSDTFTNDLYIYTSLGYILQLYTYANIFHLAKYFGCVGNLDN